MSRRFLWMAAALVALVACEKTQDELASVDLTQVENPEPWLLKDLTGLGQPGPAGRTTLGADFGGTRAHIEMNEEQTFAAWIWNPGDSFRMIAFNQGLSRYQTADFTTTGSGASAEFTSGNGFNFGAPYYAVFPGPGKVAISNLGQPNQQPMFGVTVPVRQEAVAGGVKNGYIAAYTATGDPTDVLHFSPVVTLVRFRMSGSVVSQVKTVSIKGSSTIAGDIVLLGASDGSATITDDVWFDPDERSTTVSLTGPFVAGQDYYLVVKPGTQAQFKMTFADDANHYTAKSASNFSFPVGRIVDFGTIDLGNAFEDETVNYDPIPYMTATAGAPKPVTIAVIPDGFTKDQMDNYEVLAKSGIDVLMATEPYKTYKNFFNVWILRVASKESGASVTDGNGNITKPVDTYFGSKWGEQKYGDMAANGQEVFDFVKAQCPDIKNGTHTIAEVPVMMIINDERYGGICHNYSNGQGYGMVPYTWKGEKIDWNYPNVTPSTVNPVAPEDMNTYTHWTTPEEIADLGKSSGDWRNTLVHEFGGHCFGRLGDEYWPDGTITYNFNPLEDHDWPVPFSLNLTNDPAVLPWQAEVLDYPLQTLVARDPHYSRIGLFQGGGTFLFGRWRSEMISCMIDNRFYFSTWQRMLIVKRIMSLSGSTFDAATFWANDKTADPVRDNPGTPSTSSFVRPRRVMPLLPPPVLHDEIE